MPSDDDTPTCEECGAPAEVRIFDGDSERGVYCERHATERLAGGAG